MLLGKLLEMEQRDPIRLKTEDIILVGALGIGAILMLCLMGYASQALAEGTNPAASVVESWLQGVARTLK